jgi:hypothetical protein
MQEERRRRKRRKRREGGRGGSGSRLGFCFGGFASGRGAWS